ncbi:hypothetical protein BFW01_g9566 [Lasiodiplodia theobromae]|nr:hypothetical protein BFW01_g9566 [Lasiodiplodia theobromae]
MANNQASSVIPYRMPWNDDEEEDDDLGITPFSRLPPPLLRESRAAQQAPLRRIANSRPVVGSSRLFMSKNKPRLTETTDVMGTGMGMGTTSRDGAGSEEETTSLWLTSPLCPPKSYHMYHIARSLLLSSPKYRYEALLSPPEAEAACNELLDVVLAELRRQELPNEGKKRSVRKLLLEKTCFGTAGEDDGEASASGSERRGWRPLTRRGGGKEEQTKVVKNTIVGEEIVVGGELGVGPLEAVAKLILEDVGLFMKGAGEGGEEWRLVAGAALFPSGWRLLDRIGQPGHYDCGFSLPLRGGEVVIDTFTRYFIHIARRPLYDSDTIDEKAQHIAKMLFVQIPKDFFCGEVEAELERIVIRKERNSMRRLPKSNAMTVAVRTTVQPLISMSDSDLDELECEMDGWSEQTADARGHFFWGKPLRSYIAARRMNR